METMFADAAAVPAALRGAPASPTRPALSASDLRPAQIRQGDVLLHSVPALPAGLVLLAPRPEGFALMAPTARNPGGSHVVGAGQDTVDAYGRPGSDVVEALRVRSFAWMDHDEHARQSVPTGYFSVLRQREHVATDLDSVPFTRAAAD